MYPCLSTRRSRVTMGTQLIPAVVSTPRGMSHGLCTTTEPSDPATSPHVTSIARGPVSFSPWEIHTPSGIGLKFVYRDGGGSRRIRDLSVRRKICIRA